MLFLTASCITQEKCNRLYPPQIITNTVIEYRDTVVKVFVPGETVYQKDTVFVYVDKETGQLTSKPSNLKTQLATSYAQVINGVLKHNLIQQDKELDVLIKNAIKEHSTHEVKIEEKVVYKTKLIWVFVSSLVGMILGLLIAIFIKR